jgi:hypothetical protein
MRANLPTAMRVRVKKNKASTDGKYVYLNTQKYIVDTFT